MTPIEISDRRLLQARNVERRRLAGESARGNEAVAVSHAGVAGRAEDVEALAAALQNFFGHGERHDVAGIVADLAGVEIGVFVQLAAGDGAFDGRTGRALVGVEIAAGERILARLDLHVDAAGGGEGDRLTAAKIFNHEGHEGALRKPCSRVGREFPTSRAKNAREMGHPGFVIWDRLSSFARLDSRGRLSPQRRLSLHGFSRRCSFSWAPPKRSAGTGLPGICACPRDRTSCRTRTRSGRSDLLRPRRSAAH